MSPKMKIFENLSTFAEVIGNYTKYRVLFMKQVQSGKDL